MTIQKLHLPDTGKSITLFAMAALIGGLGWSGNSTLHFLALLYPFVYIHSRRRLDTLSAVFYYAASTWPVIPGISRSHKIKSGEFLRAAFIPRAPSRAMVTS